jgi:catechol 2,3-dioxygenase-like lactoylglutathione lyase family enzyme
MPVLKRVLFNILCNDVEASVEFYTALVDFRVLYRNDWYAVLTPSGQENVQLGLIDRVSEFTPRHAWGMHEGSYLTLVVDDVFEAVERASKLGVEVIEHPVALAYGQSRALIRDPNGIVIDLSTPTEELTERYDVEFVDTDKTTAIDQRQAEERGDRTLT